MVSGTSALEFFWEGDAQSVTATVKTLVVELPSLTHSPAMRKQMQMYMQIKMEMQTQMPGLLGCSLSVLQKPIDLSEAFS